MMENRKSTVDEYIPVIQKAGEIWESFNTVHGSRKFQNNFSRSDTASSSRRDPNAMDVDAVRKGASGCFNCGGKHLARDCTKPKNACPDCKFLGGGHNRRCPRYKAVRTIGSDQADSRDGQSAQASKGETTGDSRLRGLDTTNFDAMRAYFYDMQVNEMKKQGKEFGA